MDNQIPEAALIPAAPLFTLDLAGNGGILAPASASDLSAWIETETNFWGWFFQLPNNNSNPRTLVLNAITPLRQAASLVREALQKEPNGPEFKTRIEQAKNALGIAFINKRLPHSSTPLGKNVAQRSNRDKLEAVSYVFALLATNEQFEMTNFSSWRGFLEGVIERFHVSSVSAHSVENMAQSLAELYANNDRALGEKQQSLGELQRQYQSLVIAITDTAKGQKLDFNAFIDVNQGIYDAAMAEHKVAIGNLEKVFREKMTLRAPVEYWEDRQTHHAKRTRKTGILAFGSMALLAVGIGLLAHWTFSELKMDEKPAMWRTTVLVLLGVLGVWAVRLMIRIFLSHSHLEIDAAERVTMVKTYLSLLESDKLPSDDDRKLILQALFRPASDGIVKDEGLPHPALEALTRFGKA